MAEVSFLDCTLAMMTTLAKFCQLKILPKWTMTTKKCKLREWEYYLVYKTCEYLGWVFRRDQPRYCVHNFKAFPTCMSSCMHIQRPPEAGLSSRARNTIQLSSQQGSHSKKGKLISICVHGFYNSGGMHFTYSLDSYVSL